MFTSNHSEIDLLQFGVREKRFFKILSLFEGFYPNLPDNSERKGKNIANEY